MAEQTGSKQSFDEMFSQENLFLLLRNCHLQPSVVLCSLPNFSVIFMQILSLSLLCHPNMASTCISYILLLKMFNHPTKYYIARLHTHTHTTYFNILGAISLQQIYPDKLKTVLNILIPNIGNSGLYKGYGSKNKPRGREKRWINYIICPNVLLSEQNVLHGRSEMLEVITRKFPELKKDMCSSVKTHADVQAR